MNKATEGRPATNTHGDLLITTTVEHDGIAFRTSDGVQVIDELTKTFTDRAQAAAFYRHVRDAANQGKRTYQIVWELQALEEAQNAATGRTPEQVAEAINTEVDTHHAQVVEAHNATVRTVAEVMAGTAQTGGWNGARKTAQTVTPIGRKVRPTHTRVHCKPPTPAQLDRMRQHRDGVVTCADGQPWTLLDGIVQRGCADQVSIVHHPGTQKIRSVRLNARGYAYATTSEEIAA